MFPVSLVKEEKTRLLKERLDQVHLVNERRCSQAPVYGRDLLRACSLPGQGRVLWPTSFDRSLGKKAGPASFPSTPSRSAGDLILSLNRRQESLQDVLDR